jgi:hypothetical protein
MCKSVAGREPPSKGEKSSHAAGNEGAEVAEGSRDIRGRLRAGECARWFLAQLILYPEDGGDIFLRNVG